MGLRDRIDHPDRRTDDVAPIVERRGGTEQRVPRWIARKNEQGLTPKDMTERSAA
jgi:hypothetical protein